MIKCLHTYFTSGLSKKIAPTVRKNYTKDSTTITLIYQTFATYFDFLFLVKRKLLLNLCIFKKYIFTFSTLGNATVSLTTIINMFQSYLKFKIS